MPNGIGLQELLLIALLVLLLFGPKGISGVMRDLGRRTRRLKKYRDEFTRELMAIDTPERTPEQIKKDERKRIRTQYRNILKTLTNDERKTQNPEILRLLSDLPEWQSAKTVFCFISLPEETDTLPILQAALAQGKKLVVPFCIPETRTLGLSRITDPALDLEPGVLSIPEPRKNLRTETIDPMSIDCFIIPGLAFDCELTRLGRGAGYFDRFLSPLKGKKPLWAVAFNEQIYPYTIPREEHDVSPDLVITPRTILRPKA